MKPASVPLSAAQHRALIRDARSYVVISALIVPFLLASLVWLAASIETWDLVGPTLATALFGGSLAAMLQAARQSLRDARSGRAQVRRLQLRVRIDSRRTGPRFTFATIGMLQAHATAVDTLPATPEGAWYQVIYSPRSATLWAIAPAPGADSP